MNCRPLFASVCLTLCIGGAARAALIVMEGTFTVGEGIRPELLGPLRPSDTFAFSFTYDDSATQSPSGTGRFENAVVTGGTFQKLSGPGAWNPGAGTLTAGTIITQNNSENLFGSPGVWDAVSLYPRASGFASAGDYAFGQLYVPLRRTDLSTVIDGATLVQQLAGRSINSFTWLSGPASLDFIQPGAPFPVLFQAAPGIVNVTVVPEPSTRLIVLAGLAVALRRRRKTTRIPRRLQPRRGHVVAGVNPEDGFRMARWHGRTRRRSRREISRRG